ncbi:MAG: histidine phosphatase family protein [Acidobacteria bacterium]|nr:histidine phosphatase family protein [Acidobacteriota bacterium]MCB9398790.1 histidine phosphatase family protein [Acidobacteriota bacterium]
MTRQLILMRHAKSSWEDQSLSDFERPLTPRGRRAAKKMARYLVQVPIKVDLLVSSPARRTDETAQNIIKALKLERDQIMWREEVYEADLTDLLHLLEEFKTAPQALMLIGHNPALEELLRYLSGGTGEVEGQKYFPTATVARLSMPAQWEKLRMGSASLIECVRPRFVVEG